MISITIIGSGNVASHLIAAFGNCNTVVIKQVFSRSKIDFKLPKNTELINDFAQLKPVDLIIISVSDNAIAEISNQIKIPNQLVAHTSGSMEMDILNDNLRKAVFYPLQTFSKSKKVDFSTIPIAVETQYETDIDLLQQLAKSISYKVFKINSLQRKNIHIAAVFVNNFTNHLYKIANDIADENQFPFEILLPLIDETTDKIHYLKPKEAQTGPAKRHDSITINNHLQSISNKTYHDIYQLLTKSIQENG